MNPVIIGQIVTTVVGAVQSAIKVGKTIREAIADSLEDAANKIRQGELLPDEALALAQEDQEKIEQARNKFSE